MRGGIIVLAGLALATPGWADGVSLKSGQRLEGEITERAGQIEIKSDLAVVTVPKSEVARTVRSAEKYENECKTLHAKARSFYEEALKLENDAKAANEKLKQGVDLLHKVVDLYQEA